MLGVIALFPAVQVLHNEVSDVPYAGLIYSAPGAPNDGAAPAAAVIAYNHIHDYGQASAGQSAIHRTPPRDRTSSSAGRPLRLWRRLRVRRAGPRLPQPLASPRTPAPQLHPRRAGVRWRGIRSGGCLLGHGHARDGVDVQYPRGSGRARAQRALRRRRVGEQHRVRPRAAAVQTRGGGERRAERRDQRLQRRRARGRRAGAQREPQHRRPPRDHKRVRPGARGGGSGRRLLRRPRRLAPALPPSRRTSSGPRRPSPSSGTGASTSTRRTRRPQRRSSSRTRRPSRRGLP